MPCYEVRTTNVDLKNVTNIERLLDVLASHGARVRIQDGALIGTDERGGQLRYDGTNGLQVSERSVLAQPGVVAKAYANKTVRDNARRFGWMVKETADGKLELRRN
jgi:hypothetical protein